MSAAALGHDRAEYEDRGAVRHDRAAIPVLPRLDTIVAALPPECAGLRPHGIADLSDCLSADGPIGTIATTHLGAPARAVRAVLFDKTPGTNWSLGWHQDRTIAVRARHDVPGFGPWSCKAGIQHVEPPFAIIAAMVTLRIHLDAVPQDNAPLLIAPGSHRLGRLTDAQIEAAVTRCGVVACLAGRGDVWAYATPIVHASAAATGVAHRRVLQVDYSAQDLPPPLGWLGV